MGNAVVMVMTNAETKKFPNYITIFNISPHFKSTIINTSPLLYQQRKWEEILKYMVMRDCLNNRTNKTLAKVDNQIQMIFIYLWNKKVKRCCAE